MLFFNYSKSLEYKYTIAYIGRLPILSLMKLYLKSLFTKIMNYPAASWRGISNQVCFYLIAASCGEL